MRAPAPLDQHAVALRDGAIGGPRVRDAPAEERLGVAGLAGMAASIAQILFWILLAVLVVGVVIRALRGQSVT